MTQSLKCVGSFSQDGIQFLVGVGEVWEYWEPGDYRLNEEQYVCMAVQTNGLQIFLAQGFGSGCDGVGGILSPTNGLRNLVMDRKIRLEENCEFPDWVTTHQSWQIIPQSGLRLTEDGPRQVTITTSGSFSLGAGEHLGQKFSCAKILEKNSMETKLQMFSQSQCYGEYHCFHGKYSPETNSILLHVGAPTPTIENSCQAPAFDPEVPFLRITLLPANISASPLLQPSRQSGSNSQLEQYDPHQEDSSDYDTDGVRKETIESLERETNAQIHSLTNQFSHQLTTLIQAFVGRTKYLVQQQNSQHQDSNYK